jgi:lipopolysaccharide export system permease protein
MIPDLLDRYVIRTWLRTFVLNLLGFPLVAILVDLVDRLSRLLDTGVPTRDIAKSYVYTLPEQIFLVFPAAVLFATVFTVGGLSRHSELTAAKAAGRSFHRVILPILIAAALSVAAAAWVGETATRTTAIALELQKQKQATAVDQRFNFVYRTERGWTYAITTLDARNDVLRRVILEREGRSAAYPTLVVTADSAVWDSAGRRWSLSGGSTHLVSDGAPAATFRFTSARLRTLQESPEELLADSKAPEEMTWAEMGRYIAALERSGNDAKKLRTERMLKLAIPFTCLVIALIGAPLAVTGARSGAAWGIAVSLGTSLVFLLAMQLARAVGEGGVLLPEVAAWLPNGVFLLVGLVLLRRVRT